jgi:hypothetical protein
MLTTLALRHLWVRKLRALFLLLGYALGVGVMIVLLSVGEAMLEQSRDVSLVGGGELTVLPEGIDIEAMRTGGVSGMFFGIDRARFVARQLLGGPRHAAVTRVVSPAIENKLIYLQHAGRTVTVRSGGEIPSRALEVGAPVRVLEGQWLDSRPDSAWIAPSADELYDEMDHFHRPAVADSTWAEWHYFNVETAPDEWWYLTLLVGGSIPTGRWSGQVLITHRGARGLYQQFRAAVPASDAVFDTTRADLVLGKSKVHQTSGRYQVDARAHGEAGEVTLALELRPLPQRFFPPVVLREGAVLSGYVVPALSALADGKICLNGRCESVRQAPAYHDHNWGVWRNTTWDWGAARGSTFNLLYGAVHALDSSRSLVTAPFFVALVDSLGVKQILRAREIRYRGALPASGHLGVEAPSAFAFTAVRESDSVQMQVRVTDAFATRQGTGGFERFFLQMRGSFVLKGRVGGTTIADAGGGFFETYVERRPPSRLTRATPPPTSPRGSAARAAPRAPP